MRIVVSGNNRLARAVTEFLLERGAEVVALAPEGRDLFSASVGWEEPFRPFAVRVARERGLPCLEGPINRFAGQLRVLRVDLLASCRGQTLVKPEILGLPRIGCTNLHYGALPRYGGCATIPWAILDGESEVGVTLHFMSPRFDEGPIIAQTSFPIDSGVRLLDLPGRTIRVRGRTCLEAYVDANRVALDLFAGNWARLADPNLSVEQQDASRRTYYPKTAMDYALARIIELSGADEETVGRHVRAFTFPPLQFPEATQDGVPVGPLFLRPLSSSDPSAP